MKWFTKLAKKPTRREQHEELLKVAALAYNRAQRASAKWQSC